MLEHQLLGLAYRSQNLVLGIDNIKSAPQQVQLIIVDVTVSIATQKQINRLIQQYGYDCLWYDSLNFPELGAALGKQYIKIIGICDEGFAKLLLKKVQNKEVEWQ